LLLSVDFKKREALVYDSRRNDVGDKLSLFDLIKKWLRILHQSQEKEMKDWTYVVNPNKPHEGNNNCGVSVMMACEHILLNLEINFNRRDMNDWRQKIALKILNNLTSAQTIARLQSTIEEQVDVNLSLKVAVTRLESAKEELEGDVEYYKEKYFNVVKLDKANETNERLKLENENLKRQLRGMNSSLSSSQRIDLSLPSSSSQASASLSESRKRSIGEIN
jgi:hypothetical protein